MAKTLTLHLNTESVTSSKLVTCNPDPIQQNPPPHTSFCATSTSLSTLFICNSLTTPSFIHPNTAQPHLAIHTSRGRGLPTCMSRCKVGALGGCFFHGFRFKVPACFWVFESRRKGTLQRRLRTRRYHLLLLVPFPRRGRNLELAC